MDSIKKYALVVSALLLLHAQSYAMERVADRSGSEDLSFVLNFQGDAEKQLSAFTEVYIKDYEKRRDATREQYEEKIAKHIGTIESVDATDEEKNIAQEELAFIQDRAQPCMEEYYASKIKLAAQEAADYMPMFLDTGLFSFKQRSADDSGAKTLGDQMLTRRHGIAEGSRDVPPGVSSHNDYMMWRDYSITRGKYLFDMIDNHHLTIQWKQEAALGLHDLESRWAISGFNPFIEEEKKSWYQDLGDFPDSVSSEMIEEFHKNMRNCERVINCAWLPREDRAKNAYMFYFLKKHKDYKAYSGAEVTKLLETAKRMK